MAVSGKLVVMLLRSSPRAPTSHGEPGPRPTAGDTARAATLCPLLTVWVLSSSCLGGSEADAGDAYAQDLTDLICSDLGTCCIDSGLVFDRDGCRENGLEGPRAAHVDAVAADQCLEGVAMVLASCGGSDLSTAVACARARYGDQVPGEACDAAWECARAPGSRGFALCEGACVQVTIGGDGDACARTDFELFVCGEGLACVGGVCAPPLAAGEQCDPNAPSCDEGLTCARREQPSGGFTALMCVSAIGTPCSVTGGCPEGLGCNPLRCTCEPLRAEGEACDDDTQCSSALCIGNTCRRGGIATPTNCGSARGGARFNPPIHCPGQATGSVTAPPLPGGFGMPTPTPAP